MTLHHALRAMQHGASYDADAAAYIAAAGELFPSALNDLVVGAKAAGVWTILGSIKKALGTPSLAASVIDLRNPAFNGTAVNTPTRSATAGWTFDSGSSQYIDSAWKIGATGSNASQNSVHIGLRLRALSSGAAFFSAAFASATGNFLGFNPVQEDGTSFYGNDGTGIADTTHTVAPSHIIGTRTGASAEAIYRAGSSVKTGTPASGTAPNFNVPIGALSLDGSLVGYGDGRVTLWHAGGAFNSTQAAAWTTLCNTYATAAGET